MPRLLKMVALISCLSACSSILNRIFEGQINAFNLLRCCGRSTLRQASQGAKWKQRAAVLCAFIALFSFVFGNWAQAQTQTQTQTASACAVTSGHEALSALASLAQATDAIPVTEVLPAGTNAQIILGRTFKPEERLIYKAVVADESGGKPTVSSNSTAKPPNPELISGASISAKQVASDNPLVLKNLVESTSTFINIVIPEAFGDW
jgi:hypothetical protein